ncbi:MAG TPA: chorismate mutase [Allosphingosinicella sp.]|jgi:isochorismate pyruvate lyase
MHENPKDPAACRTMAEVRHGIDRLDLEIAQRLGRRFRYMDAAARIKEERSTVRDEARKAQVLANVAAAARREGVPVELAAALYEQLIEASIAYELERFDALRAEVSPAK